MIEKKRISKSKMIKENFNKQLYMVLAIAFSVIVNDKIIYPIWSRLGYERNIIIKIVFTTIVAFTMYAALNIVINKDKTELYIDVFMILYILFIISITFFKAKLSHHSFVLNPFASIIDIKISPIDGTVNIFGNFLMYIPIGSYIKSKLNFNRNRMITYFVIYITCVEITQAITKTGTCDMNDIIMNTLGFIIGLIIL